jgi:hypothetical protein
MVSIMFERDSYKQGRADSEWKWLLAFCVSMVLVYILISLDEGNWFKWFVDEFVNG